MRGLLTLHELKEDKIQEIINYALKLKGGFSKKYVGKKMATLFFENSTRTQYSFQVAMMNLGIQVVGFNASVSSVQKGETLYDTVRTFESLGLDGVAIRSSEDNYFEKLKNIKMPIFNGGDGASNHPTQCLLDLMTIYEEYGHFKGLKVCMIGDISHSRVAHGNIDIMQRLGMEVYISGPEEYNDGSAKYMDFDKAIKTCDVIMMLRVQFERHKEKMHMTEAEYFAKYGLDNKRVAAMKDTAIIMHPAPVNRNIEIGDDVVECSKSRIYKQMTNGVYVRMAVISMVLDGDL